MEGTPHVPPSLIEGRGPWVFYFSGKPNKAAPPIYRKKKPGVGPLFEPTLWKTIKKANSRGNLSSFVKKNFGGGTTQFPRKSLLFRKWKNAREIEGFLKNGDPSILFKFYLGASLNLFGIKKRNWGPAEFLFL